MKYPAAAHPTPRFDIYRDVHKGLRAFMADTLVALARMDTDDGDDVAQVLEQLQELMHTLSAHIQHENDHVHPAIELHHPGTVSRVADQHAEHAEAIAELLEGIDSVRESATPQTRREAALRLYRRFAVFVGENLEHMNVEETAHNAALWSVYSDAEIVGIHEALLRAVEPARMGVFLRWIVPNLSHPERVDLLSAVRASAPPAAFDQLLGMARLHMRVHDWNKLAATLTLSKAA